MTRKHRNPEQLLCICYSCRRGFEPGPTQRAQVLCGRCREDKPLELTDGYGLPVEYRGPGERGRKRGING